MTGELLLTRRVAFCASHRLFRPDWTDEENLRVFGKCAHPGGHGHNYELELTLRGQVNPETGMVMDLKDVKEILRREFFEQVDHRDLNTDVDFMRGRIPTAENIVIAAWERLSPHFPEGMMMRLRLHETANNYVEYHGPQERRSS